MNNRGGRASTSLVIRLLVGAYLLYIDYQIFADVMAREGTSRIVMTVIMAAFAIIGLSLIILSAMGFLGYGPWGISGSPDRDAGDPAEDHGKGENDEQSDEHED